MRDLRAAWEEEPDDAGEVWDADDEELEEEDYEEELEEEDYEEDDYEEDEDLDDEGDLDLDLDALDDEALEFDADEGSELAGTVAVFCPYCGAGVEMIVDSMGGDVQEYVEDCEVCCQPWSVRVTLDRDGNASVELGTLDDG